ncbi:MAG: hypothetical protein WAP58_10220 [Peptococcia bacterium]
MIRKTLKENLTIAGKEVIFLGNNILIKKRKEETDKKPFLYLYDKKRGFLSSLYQAKEPNIFIFEVDKKYYNLINQKDKLFVKPNLQLNQKKRL